MAAKSDGVTRFNALFEANYDPILRYCLRRLPLADANDAASEVFVVAWRRIAESPDGDESRLWLYGIARNVVRNTQRSARRSLRLSVKLGGLAERSVEGPETQVVQSDELRQVLEALDRLPMRDREILRLRAMEQLSLAEIALVVDCSEAAARKRFDRATKRLQRKVSDPVLTPSSIPCESEGEVTA